MLKYIPKTDEFSASSLFQNAVRDIIHEAGFSKKKIGKSFILIQKKGCVISEVTPEIIKDYMTAFVTRLTDPIYFSYENEEYEIPAVVVRETYFRNSNNIFNRSWLEQLKIDEEPILKDTESEIYLFFKNAIVSISKAGYKTEKLENKSGFCIWDTQITPYDFVYNENFKSCHFYNFLKNVTNNEAGRFDTIISGIGYLMHHYFRESEGQAVIFYDQNITDTKNPMGGSGKGLIVNALKQVRNTSKIDGKHFDAANRFRWEKVTESTQIVWLDDAKPDFDFSTLHSNLTDGWTVEAKHRHQLIIPPPDSPKVVICSNSILKGGGTTNKRRQFEIELSNYYSRQIITGIEKPIEDTHNGRFFSGQWAIIEWQSFFSVMVYCAVTYLKNGLQQGDTINVESNRLRQITEEDFVEWAELQKFEPGNKYNTSELHHDYLNLFYGDTNSQIGQRKFTGYLKEYAVYRSWKFIRVQSNGISFFTFSI